ncbi:hypothetical protein [Streptomyces sp. NPDC088794]|uniref:hypothetical protein n=1 Tax=Streptomyces sp. NPDC088794 TaxID=3365902 RepID=UPI00381196FD
MTDSGWTPVLPTAVELMTVYVGPEPLVDRLGHIRTVIANEEDLWAAILGLLELNTLTIHALAERAGVAEAGRATFMQAWLEQTSLNAQEPREEG